MTDMLFAGYPDPPQAERDRLAPETEQEKRHRRRRQTIENRRARQFDAITRGVHPLNGRPLLDALERHTCGDCAHRFLKRLAKPYPKCDLGPLTGGPGTDVLASWPACEKWEPKHGDS